MRGLFKIANLFLNCPTILCIVLQKIVPGKECKILGRPPFDFEIETSKTKLKTYYNITALRN